MNFSVAELVDIIYTLGECGKNCLLASRVYKERYPERRCPQERSFIKVKERFERTANANYRKPIKHKPVLDNEDVEFNVVASLVEDPQTSMSVISKNINISRTSVRRITKKNKFHPYHFRSCQRLQDRDFWARLNFCEWTMNVAAQNPGFFDHVLFTDESSFRNTYFNKHNMHHYATENPHVVRPVEHQYNWSINVWGGILGNYVIGPYFFPGTLNGEIYLDFLTNQLPLLLENVPLNIRRNMWLQLDGAPPHYTQRVRDFLNTRYPNQWIGRRGPVLWPARSPDITKMDFFFWGHIKDIVYRVPATTAEDMRQRIINAFSSITPEVLDRVQISFMNRVRRCAEQHGGIFEQFLN